MSQCRCTGSCLLHLERRKDGPFPECAPAEHYFTVTQDRYVLDANGECEWDGIFLPGRHATLEDALRVVRAGSSMARYVVQEHPRFGMCPPWAGYGGRDGKNQYAKVRSYCEEIRLAG